MKIQGEQKRTNYKMYKDGKKWIFACALVGGLMIGGTTIAQADSTTDPTISTTTSVTTETNAPQPGDVITEYIPASDINPAATNETVVDYYQGQNNNYSQNTDGTYTPLTDTEQAAVNATSNADATSTTYSTDLNAISSAVDAQAPSIADDGQNYKVETTDDASALPAGLDPNHVYSETIRHYLETSAATENDTIHTIAFNGTHFQRVIEVNGTYSFVNLTTAELTDLQTALGKDVVSTVSYNGTAADLQAAYDQQSSYVGAGFILITTDDVTNIPTTNYIDVSTEASTEYANPNDVENEIGYSLANVTYELGSYYTYVPASDGTVIKTQIQLSDAEKKNLPNMLRATIQLLPTMKAEILKYTKPFRLLSKQINLI